MQLQAWIRGCPFVRGEGVPLANVSLQSEVNLGQSPLELSSVFSHQHHTLSSLSQLFCFNGKCWKLMPSHNRCRIISLFCLHLTAAAPQSSILSPQSGNCPHLLFTCSDVPLWCYYMLSYRQKAELLFINLASTMGTKQKKTKKSKQKKKKRSKSLIFSEDLCKEGKPMFSEASFIHFLYLLPLCSAPLSFFKLSLGERDVTPPNWSLPSASVCVLVLLLAPLWATHTHTHSNAHMHTHTKTHALCFRRTLKFNVLYCILSREVGVPTKTKMLKITQQRTVTPD